MREKLLYSHLIFSVIANVCVLFLWLDMGKPMPWFVFTVLGCALVFIIHNAFVYKVDSVCSNFIQIHASSSSHPFLLSTAPCSCPSVCRCDCLALFHLGHPWSWFSLVGFHHDCLFFPTHQKKSFVLTNSSGSAFTTIGVGICYVSSLSS